MRCSVSTAASLEERQRGSYREKLIAALHHPLADVRMRVIIALGLQRHSQAEEALIECPHPSDVVEGLDTVNRLRLIATPGSARPRFGGLPTSTRPDRCRRTAREAIDKLKGAGSTA